MPCQLHHMHCNEKLYGNIFIDNLDLKKFVIVTFFIYEFLPLKIFLFKTNLKEWPYWFFDPLILNQEVGIFLFLFFLSWINQS